MNLKNLRIIEHSPMFLAKKHLFDAMKRVYKVIYLVIQGNPICSQVKLN